MKHRNLAAVLCSLVALSGCAGGQTGQPGFLPARASNAVWAKSLRANARPRAHEGITLLVANRGGGNVLGFYTELLKAGTDNVAPQIDIGGNKTMLSVPIAVTASYDGHIYAVNDSGSQIYVFAPGANGNVAPSGVIGGSNTKLAKIYALTLDAAGNIWVACGNNAVYEYKAGASGNVAPIAAIAGSNTGIGTPVAIAEDSEARMRVANYDGTVLAFAYGATGNVKPVIRLGGSATHLSHVGGMYAYPWNVDGTSYFAVADSQNAVYVFKDTATGNVAPSYTLAGANTKLSGPSGIGEETTGFTWVSNSASNSIDEYQNFGNVTPGIAVAGPKTQLNDPIGMFVAFTPH
ncbi:MAG: hypothetical protein JO199_11355 [Candidatus Eremiobacteraeota bacterium]|nr:hypothetical protein [Candidatus Eremiobacteraeota bacterium]